MLLKYSRTIKIEKLCQNNSWHRSCKVCSADLSLFYAEIQAVGWSSLFHPRAAQQYFCCQHLMCPELLLPLAPALALLVQVLSGTLWGLSGSCCTALSAQWEQDSSYASLSQEKPSHHDKSPLGSDWTAILLCTLLTQSHICNLKLIFCCNPSVFSQEEQLDLTELVWNYLKNWSRNCFEKFLYSNTYTFFFISASLLPLYDSEHRTAQ